MSLALLCPGQGGQHPQMFQRVIAQPAAAAVLAAAQAVLGMSAADAAADAGRYDNAVAQPLVCAGALAHWQVLRAALPAPLMVLGYSVGELAAHAVAGSLAPVDCLRLAARRAQLMHAVGPADGGLLALGGLGLDAVQALAQAEGVDLAIVNGEDQCVLGGLLPALRALAEQARARGARAQILPVSVPAHTHWLQPAAEAFAQALAASPIGLPSRLLLAGVDARPVRTRDAAIATLSAQLARTVQWRAVLEQAAERGARVFLELGPGGALARMAREALPDCQARSVEDFHGLQGIADWVGAACERAG